MLFLIGLGLWDSKDITLRGLEIVKNSDAVYAELYTSKLGVGVEELEKFFGRKIEVLKREDLEDKSYRILERAKKEDIAILVAG
ncbi:MAG: diphthine synthase, partial [Archaeoglobi archaeon]